MEWFPLYLFIILGAIIVTITYFRHRERMSLISRGINPHASQVPTLNVGTKSLFLGLFCAALGLAFIIGGFITDSGDHDLMFTGFIFLFVGAAIFGYWKITEKDRELSRRMYEARLESLRAGLSRDTEEYETGDADTFDDRS